MAREPLNIGESVKFKELELHPLLQKGIDELGFEDCTPIQEKSFALISEGQDIAGLAQTGTGKTAAFLIPLIERLLRSKEEAPGLRGFKDYQPHQYVLVLVPTRELAEQVFDNFNKLTQYTDFKASVIYGGTSYEGQKKSLREGVQLIVATPGRLIDLYKEHIMDLAQVCAIVFDEADRMFDMGFKDDMKYILQRVPMTRQFLVFSATLDFEVLNVAYEFGSHPVEINVSEDGSKADNVVDEIFHVGQKDKPQYLLSVIKKYKPKQVIIFSNFKRNVERLAPFLTSNGYPAEGISSLLTQHQRSQIMNNFKSDTNELNILVATDVAARGLDIKNVDMVINYELSDDSANYIHRIGRTGRAGEKGRAYSLVSDRDVDSLARIEDYIGHKLPIAWLEDADLVTEFKTMSYESPYQKISNNYQERKKSKTSKVQSGSRRERPLGKKTRTATGSSESYKKKGDRRTKIREGEYDKETKDKTHKQHRDRITGRHGAAKSSTGVSEEIFKEKRSNKKKYNKKRRRTGGSPLNGKTSSRSTVNISVKPSNPTTSVSGKIKSFIKNLFS